MNITDMKFKKLFLNVLLASLLVLGSCGENIITIVGGGSGYTPIPGGEEDRPMVGWMDNTNLQGIVTDADGNGIEGVTVTSGTATTITDAGGGFAFTMSNVADNRLVAHFDKEGYFSVTRSYTYSPDNTNWTVVMIPESDRNIATESTFSSSSAETLQAGGFTVELPAGSFINKATGERYNGTVKAKMAYLSPDNEDFSTMMAGGDMAGVRSNGRLSTLLSYGMTNVSLTDSEGNKLQLDGVHEATLAFPIPESMKDRTPASIPLWSFNESTGLWEEEGVAELRNGVYVGTVKHFSWTNLDDPEETAKIEGYVCNSDGVYLSGITVNVNQISIKTDKNGHYECAVPSDCRFEVKVNSKSYGRYKNIAALSVDPLEPGEERMLPTLVLPKLNIISGQIVNTAGGSVVCSIILKYGNRSTETVKSNFETGQFTIYAPEGYSGAALLEIITIDSEVITMSLNLGNSDLNLGVIEISTVSNLGGKIDITLNNGTQTSINIPSFENGFSGAYISPGSMIVVNEENDEGYFYLSIPGYNEDQTDYTGGVMQMSNNGTELVCPENLSSKVTRKGNFYSIDFSGNGQYYSYDAGLNEVAFSASNIGIPVLMNYYVKANVSDPIKECGLPSYTPYLSVNAPVVFVITESSVYGKGGMICYNGSLADYTILRNQVPGSFTVLTDDSYDEYGESYCEFVAYSGDKVISIYFDSSALDISGDTVNDIFDMDSRLAVTVLDGVSESFWAEMTRSDLKPLRKFLNRNK